MYSVDIESAPMMGARSAPHTLLVFSDFECPYCKLAASKLKQFHAAHPDRVAIYFKHFPLRQHRYAERAAKAAEAARLQGKFWEMHDAIFARAGSLDADTFDEISASLGLDMARFERDMKSKVVADRVASDMAEGEALGLFGTPFFVLDGVPFDDTIDALIARLEE